MDVDEGHRAGEVGDPVGDLSLQTPPSLLFVLVQRRVTRHRVADRDHPDQLAVIHHRKMPNVALSHDLRGVGYIRVRRHGNQVGGHALADAHRRGVRAIGDEIDVVALGDDAGWPLRTIHDQRRDPVLSQNPGGVRAGLVLPDRHDVAMHDVSHTHG